MKLKSLYLTVCAAGLLVPQFVFAQIAVRPIRLVVSSGQRYADISVRNTSSSKVAFVTVKAKRLINPGLPDASEMTSKNPKKLLINFKISVAGQTMYNFT